MNSKERAELRAAANKLEPVIYIGKDGLSENTVKEADDALRARELIKLSVQKTCELPAREASIILCNELGADGIQVIGRRFCIYRKNPDAEIQKKARQQSGFFRSTLAAAAAATISVRRVASAASAAAEKKEYYPYTAVVAEAAAGVCAAHTAAVATAGKKKQNPDYGARTVITISKATHFKFLR